MNRYGLEPQAVAPEFWVYGECACGFECACREGSRWPVCPWCGNQMDPRPVNLEAPQGSEERVNGRQGLVAFRMVEPVAVTIVRHWDGTLQRARAEQDADGNPL